MAVVDDLQVKIQADAVRANDAIDKLIGKLDRLSTSIGSLDTSRLNSLSNGVTRLTTAMAGMSNVKTSEFTRLAKNIEKLAALDASKLNQSAGSIHQFANSLGSLNTINVTDSAKNIAELAKGISQLGYKSSTKAIQNIPQLATAMHQLMTTLSTAPQVSQNIINMTNALAKLARTGSSSGKAATSLGRSLESYTKSTTRATKGTFSLAGAIGKIYATYWLLFRAMGKIKSAIDISSQLTEVQNVVDVTFGKMSHKIEEFTENSIEKFGMSELSAKKYASTFQAMGSAMGIDTALIGTANKFLNQQTAGYVGLSNSMADVSVTLTKLTADMASFYNVEQKAVAEDLSAIFTGQTRPLRQYGIDLTEATLKEWALSEGMNANIKSMTQAEKTMLRYQYVLAHTGAAQGDFERTVNTWANQVRILKQNFEQLGAVVGGTFINMLKPLVKALNNVMSHIIAFAQTVSNALGKIFGWTYESGGGVASDMENAADYSEDLAGGLSDAEKNAKKLKSHLLGIDELNVFDPSEDKSGTSGSGSASSGANANGGQWVKADGIFKSFESEIDTLFELGEKISQTLTKAMDSIDWEKIYKRAEGFGRKLAQFLNGLISPELFGTVGSTIASSLNAAIYAALSFAKTFNFHEFGVSLATAVNEFFKTFDFQSLAEGLNKWVDGIEETIKGFLETISLTDIVNGIDGFLGELELDTVVITIAAFTIKGNVKKLLAAAIAKSVVGGITLEKIPLIFGSFAIPGTPAFDTVGNYILTWIENSIAEILPEWAQKMIGNIVLGMSTGGLAGSVIPGIGTLAGAIIGALSGALFTEVNGSNILEKLLEPIFNFDRSIAIFEDIKEKFKKGGLYIVLGIGEGVLGALSFLLEPFTDLFDFVFGTICGIFGIHSPAETMKPLGENIFLGIVDGFRNAFGIFTESVTEFYELHVAPWFTIEKWSNIFNNISIALETIWNNIALWWSTTAIYGWWHNDVAPWFKIKKWSELLQVIPDSFETAFEDAKEWVKEKVQSMWDFVDDIVGKMKDAIDSIGERISNAVAKVKSFGGSISAKISGVDGFATGGYPTSASLFWAGENGVPEILGTVGGKTAVAGGAEITGIRDAVYDVGNSETTLLRMAVSLLETIAAKDTATYIDGRELVNAYDERKSRNGFSFT